MEDAPTSSRRARRKAASPEAHAAAPEATAADVVATPGEITAPEPDAAEPGSQTPLAAWATPTHPATSATLPARVALGWIDDAALATRPAPTDLRDSENSFAVVSPDLLARRPRRSPLRAGVVMPILTVLAIAGAYAATTLLWPLYAVTPTTTEVAVADVAAPASAVVWPAAGAGAVGVAGFGTGSESTNATVSMASITKLVTAQMILEQMPLALGESGPEFTFTQSDRRTYYNYLADDESALDVPVGGTLTEYQMLQGMLIGSAGNYTDRLASTIWPTESVFASAAHAWLATHDLSGITVVEPTGIDPANTADPASLITLAKTALADPVIAEIVRTRSVTLPGAGEVVNTNDLLADPAVVGVKTGSLKGAYNLLAAKDLTVGETPVRVFATALAQPDDAARDDETARLLALVAAEVSQPVVLPAGTVVGTVATKWGATSKIVTDADATLILWNAATSQVSTTLDLGDARAAGDAVGTVTVKGPLNTASTDVHLTADIPGPDAWWRLTHPLELFGLAG